MISIKRILVPTDFSEYSMQAITYASELARRFAAELHLLHVAVPLAMPMPYMGTVSDEVFDPEKSATKALTELEHPAFETLSPVQRIVRTGTPFVEIVRHAKENDVDLIVMGTHGRTGLVHALIGSVAERVVRHAATNVYVVRQ